MDSILSTDLAIFLSDASGPVAGAQGGVPAEEEFARALDDLEETSPIPLLASDVSHSGQGASSFPTNESITVPVWRLTTGMTVSLDEGDASAEGVGPVRNCDFMLEGAAETVVETLAVFRGIGSDSGAVDDVLEQPQFMDRDKSGAGEAKGGIEGDLSRNSENPECRDDDDSVGNADGIVPASIPLPAVTAPYVTAAPCGLPTPVTSEEGAEPLPAAPPEVTPSNVTFDRSTKPDGAISPPADGVPRWRAEEASDNMILAAVSDGADVAQLASEPLTTLRSAATVKPLEAGFSRGSVALDEEIATQVSGSEGKLTGPADRAVFIPQSQVNAAEVIPIPAQRPDIPVRINSAASSAVVESSVLQSEIKVVDGASPPVDGGIEYVEFDYSLPVGQGVDGPETATVTYRLAFAVGGDTETPVAGETGQTLAADLRASSELSQGPETPLPPMNMMGAKASVRGTAQEDGGNIPLSHEGAFTLAMSSDGVLSSMADAQMDAIGSTPTQAALSSSGADRLYTQTTTASAHNTTRQIAQAVHLAKEGSFELTLSPVELGRLHLKLDADGDGVSVSISAERAETLDLVRRNVDSLARDLRDLGYTQISFSFGDHGGGEKLPESPARISEETSAAELILPDDTSPVPALQSSHGSLDLRI